MTIIVHGPETPVKDGVQMPVDLEVVKKAYGWSIAEDGQVHGLTAGDMGFEPSGIFIPLNELIGFAENSANIPQKDLPAYKAGYDSGYENALKLVRDNIMKKILE